VADVLEAVPISRRVLEKGFRTYLGRTPHQEILRVQLSHVAALLRDTDLSLEKIAVKCGFRHVEYMTVVFKRELGQTPSQYRQQRT
jgi:LacI family transcriptional regulator